MLTKTDLYDLAKSLARNFVLPVLAKSVLYAVLGGLIFFIAGLLVYNFGTGLPIEDLYVALRLTVAFLTVAIYTVLRTLLGLGMGATSVANNKLGEAEQEMHKLIAPLTGGVVEKIPIGQEGISIEQFNQVVDASINNLTKESVHKSRVFSVASFFARIIIRRLLAITRTILLVDFVRDLQQRGETRVNIHSIEKFTREKLVRLVTNSVRLKLLVARKVALLVSAVLLFIPALLVGLSLIL